MSTQAMMQLLEKINSKDKDFRYMATSDLLTELQKDTFRVDGETEKKLCTAILAQLDDLSGDISSLAVRCLGMLVRKVNEARSEDMVSQLCEKATSVSTKKEQQRDVASIGLKTIIGEMRGLPIATQLAQTITKKMLAGMAKDNVDVVSDSIDVLSEVVDKCGSSIGLEHSRVRDALLPYLDDARAPVRKRALHCLAGICLYLSDDLLGGCVKALVDRLQAGNIKPDFARTYSQALGHISRVVGYRFGRYLPDVVPLLIQFCNKAGDSDDELKEHCLQALESIVTHVPLDAKAHLEPILKVALANLKYDPNYAADEDEEDNGMEEDDDGADEEEEEEDEEGYSDDEDVSWKVRRAAVKVLTALLLAYPDALPALYAASAGALVGCFREREESVRGDMFNAFVTLARQVGATAYRYEPNDPNSPLARLAANVPDVAKAMARQLKERNVKSRVGGFQLLKELAGVVPAAVAAQLGLLLPGTVSALTDKSSAASGLKIEALIFTRSVLASGPQGSSADLAALKQLAQAVLPCVSDRYYKLSAEAIRVLEQLVCVVRPGAAAAPADLSALPMPAVFSALQGKLLTPDQDQEVKEAAISASATVVARCGDLLGAELPVVLRTLLDRLRNEITRLAAVRAFSVVAASALPLDLAAAGVLEPVTAELTSFLRRALLPLRLASLLALEAVVAKYGAALPAPLLASLVEETAGLIVDTDLALAAQGLRTLSVLLRVQPEAAQFAASKALPAALLLVRSPLLQGAALDQLNAFLTALAAAKLPGAGVDELLAALLQTGRGAGAGARSAQLAVAQCVAVLASSAGTQKVGDTAQSLLSDMSGKDLGAQRLNLLCLGELGRRADLSGLPQVEAAVRSALASDSEDVKGAASLALGGISCGNLTQYMPSLLRQIKEAPNPKQQYLLLTALNEVLTTISAPTTLTPPSAAAAGAQHPGVAPAPAGAPAPQPQLSQQDEAAALALLLGSADTAQEECRMVIAECLGRLALLYPQQVLAELQQRLADKSASMRSVVVSSLKYMVTERPHAIDAPLAAAVPPFLSLISDPSHHVRRAAIVSLTAIVHQKPSLVVSSRDGAAPALSALLPPLYENTVIRPDLIRTVDLGPFKHQIDDGLELRKATFECLDILLDTPSCISLLDVPTFLKHLQSGLGDHVDIKAPCHLMLAKVAGAAPTPVLSGVEHLVAPLEATLTTRLKGDPVKQEVDRHEDMLRSCLRAIHAVAQLPGVEACTPFQAFMRRTVLVAPIKDKYALVVKEWQDADAMDTA